ncbi:MAG: hypothetical protein LBV43_02315, partial [Prevotella sp.]|nr:hypothetical protein [Prevotella sp.]
RLKANGYQLMAKSCHFCYFLVKISGLAVGADYHPPEYKTYAFKNGRMIIRPYNRKIDCKPVTFVTF